MTSPYVEVLQGMTKAARIYGRPPFTPGEDSWSDRYKGTPFYQEAIDVERQEALDDVQRAKAHAAEEGNYLEEGQFRMEQAQLEADLAQWRYEQMGLDAKKSKLAARALTKVAYLGCCKSAPMPDSGRDWADYFKDTPFHARALDLERRDAAAEAKRAQDDLTRPRENTYAKQRARRTELEARYLTWKQQQSGKVKTAAEHGVIGRLYQNYYPVGTKASRTDILERGPKMQEEMRAMQAALVEQRKLREQQAKLPGIRGAIGRSALKAIDRDISSFDDYFQKTAAGLPAGVAPWKLRPLG